MFVLRGITRKMHYQISTFCDTLTHDITMLKYSLLYVENMLFLHVEITEVEEKFKLFLPVQIPGSPNNASAH